MIPPSFTRRVLDRLGIVWFFPVPLDRAKGFVKFVGRIEPTPVMDHAGATFVLFIQEDKTNARHLVALPPKTRSLFEHLSHYPAYDLPFSL